MKTHYLLLTFLPLIFAFFYNQKPQPSTSAQPLEFTPTPTATTTHYALPTTNSSTQPTTNSSSLPTTTFLKILKDVGEPQYDHFGLTEKDFQTIKDAHFTHISTNFDLCSADTDVKWYLDMAQKYNLKVILNAGAGEAEWGYKCNEEPYPLSQKPIWQKAFVTTWINKWKNHPALFAWDISNEGGLNFPNGENNPQIGENWQQNAVTLAQLQQAAQDVRTADPNHPRYMRMSGYVFYEHESNFFAPTLGNPFAANIAEYVMVNTYSNTDDYDPQLVIDIASKAQKSIQAVDPNTKIIFALGIWQGPPMWQKPSSEQVQEDYKQALKFKPAGLGYFKYGAPQGTEWYAPDPQRGSPSLWKLMTALNY